MVDLRRATRNLEHGFPFVPYLPGWALPQRFEVSWDDGTAPIVTLEFAVSDGRCRCVRVSVAGRSDAEVSGSALREVPVARLTDDAIALAVARADKSKPVRFKSIEEFHEFRRAHPHHRERERWALTPEHLREVVRVYRQGGRYGVAEVARHFNRPRATASRWVQLAKAEGYFDEVKPRAAKRPRKKGLK